MSPAGTTIPAAGIGVWEGARVVILREGLEPRRGIAVEPHRSPGHWVVWLLPPHDSAESLCDGYPHAHVGPRSDVPRAVIHPHIERICIDLTHHPTQLEVMARLGARVRMDIGRGVVWFEWGGRRQWAVEGMGGESVMWGATGESGVQAVPALADLDPTDDTRLDDGARLVDVRALAIVAARVFGSG